MHEDKGQTPHMTAWGSCGHRAGVSHSKPVQRLVQTQLEKKKGRGSQVRHSALAEPLAPPLRLQGCLREKPWPPNSLLPPLPGKQHPQPPHVMVIWGLAVHLEHFQSPPPLVAHSPHGRAPLGRAGPPQPPSLPCHPLSRAKTCCCPVLPATSQRETQLQVQPAFNAGRHWGGHSTTSPGRSTTKSCSPKLGWLRAAVPASPGSKQPVGTCAVKEEKELSTPNGAFSA